MRSRRQQRYKTLRAKGFLAFEARELSVVPIKSVPYMKGIIKERQGLLRDADREKATTAQYEAEIRAMYNKNGFIMRNKVGKVVANPWAFFADYEDRYKAKNPAYESPWLKRRRSLVDFMAKIEKTLAAQNKLRERMA